MPVEFNGTDLTPAPLVTIDKSFVLDDQENVVGTVYTYTLSGTIVNIDNSLDSPGATSNTGMVGILGAQEYIRSLFSEIGLLEISAPGSITNKISAYVNPQSVTFNEGVWVDRCQYTVVLVGHGIVGETFEGNNLEDTSESWSIAENPNGTRVLTHNVSATGRSTINDSGVVDTNYQTAKDWVQARKVSITGGELSSTSGYIGAELLLDDYGEWNRSQSEEIDTQAGFYSLSETFLQVPSGNVIEEQSFSVSKNDSNLYTINYQGTIQGLADTDNDYITKYTNAKNYYDTNFSKSSVYSLATSKTGLTINPNPRVQEYTSNENQGTVSWSYSFVGGNFGVLASGSLEESVEISDTGPMNIFATIDIPGRASGQILQDMGTVTLPERQVSITAKMPLPSGSILEMYNSKPDVSSVITALKPAGVCFSKGNTESWNPLTGDYSRSITWVMKQIDESGVPENDYNSPSGSGA